MARSLLIVDDELDIQSSLAFALKDEGYEVFTASSPKEAEQILATNHIELGLFDVWFPEGDGLELLKVSKVKYPKASFVMMSGHGNIELALKAIRMGAFDFLEKPLELEKVLVVLRNAAEIGNLRKENRRLTSQLTAGTEFLGKSGAIAHLKTQIQNATVASSHVLIRGENGVGKELVAHSLHDLSPRSEKPFVALNCAAVPESLFESELFGHEKGSFTGALSRSTGRFEQAASGTLFLDEIGELSLNAQGKLLRVLEDRKFERVGGRQSLKSECRVIAATNRDLSVEIKAGRFREDLYFRLNVLSILVPPLRDRSEDIPDLVAHFLKFYSAEYARAKVLMKPELIVWMQRYEWPGNVRELRNLIERLLIMNPQQFEFGISDLPEELQAIEVSNLKAVSALSGTLRDLRAQFERQMLEQRIEHHQGNVTRAAESLGIERAHLHRKIKQYGIVNSAKGDSH
jgi:two-component system nitrogen regulation response regulator NtrX